MRLMRWAMLGMTLALPITCAQGPTDGTYSGGLEPSPGGRVNPMEPGFANSGGASR